MIPLILASVLVFAAGPRPGPACPATNKALVAEGKKVFTELGNCAACHGMDAKGTPTGPDLTKKKWLNIDGSFAAISKLVTTGVPTPKKYPAAMPPMGAAKLEPGQICAVASYVFSLRKGAR